MRLQPVLEFGEFRFDPATPLLTRGSRALELSPKALEILAVLIKNAGRVVGKDDLLKIVWPDAVVEEGNLAVHIFALRKALGQDVTAVYIENIPKRGYRFSAPVHPILDATNAPAENDERDLCRIAQHYVQQQSAEGFRKAAATYEECIASEPWNAKARAGLAGTLLLRFFLGDLNRDEGVSRATALLAQANEIDPSCVDVDMVRWQLDSVDWQWQRAEEELQRVLELVNNNEARHLVGAWYGSYLVLRGEVERGLRELRRANAACPLSPIIWTASAGAQFLARDFLGCLAVSREAIQLHPHCWVLYKMLGKALTAVGEYGEAIRCFRRASLLDDGAKGELLSDLAYLHAVAGKRDRAVRLLERMQLDRRRQHVSLIFVAKVHAVLRNKDRALDYIEQACSERDPHVAGLKQDTRLDPLRSAPRYRRVLAQVGI